MICPYQFVVSIRSSIEKYRQLDVHLNFISMKLATLSQLGAL
jgi:hypothetical protein